MGTARETMVWGGMLLECRSRRIIWRTTTRAGRRRKVVVVLYPWGFIQSAEAPEHFIGQICRLHICSTLRAGACRSVPARVTCRSVPQRAARCVVANGDGLRTGGEPCWRAGPGAGPGPVGLMRRPVPGPAGGAGWPPGPSSRAAAGWSPGQANRPGQARKGQGPRGPVLGKPGGVAPQQPQPLLHRHCTLRRIGPATAPPVLRGQRRRGQDAATGEELVLGEDGGDGGKRGGGGER